MQTHPIAVASGISIEHKKKRSKLLCFMNFKLHTKRFSVLYILFFLFPFCLLSPRFRTHFFSFALATYVHNLITCERAFVPTWWWTGCYEKKRENMENHFCAKLKIPYAVFYTLFVRIQLRPKERKFRSILCVFFLLLLVFTSLRSTTGWILLYLNLWWRKTRNCVAIFRSFFGLPSVLPSINYSYNNVIAMDRTTDVGASQTKKISK